MGPMGAGLGGAISAASGLYSARDQMAAMQAQLDHSMRDRHSQPPIFYQASSGLGGQELKKNKKGTIMDHLRDYFKNNRDLIFNIGLIILVDHFVFKGAFREKIKNMVSTFCDKTHKMLEDTNHGKS